jgi:type 1 glutamine amidotransferase
MSLQRCSIVLGIWLTLTATAMAAPIKTLIVDGQNAHNWKEATPILKQLMEESDLFTVDVATSPAQGKDMSGFQPNFAAYQLVVLNYQGDDWSKATQKAFVDYVANGGGVVCYHFAAAAFPNWKEYNEIIGLGGWGGRNEKAGPYLCWRDDKIVSMIDPPGISGFHGAQQTFQVVVRQPDHPITKGLPPAFMQSADELYCRMRGPAENCEVLATAFAPKAKGGTDENEPMLMTIKYGNGRVFWTVLGHAGEQLKSVAFITTFLRGAEWAATGNVTQKVPDDMPTADKPSIRETAQTCAPEPWVVYDGFDGPGKGKHIVLVSGDEEYRSEQALPQLGKILAKRHGFKCTVLFAIDPSTGKIDSRITNNIPGLEALKTADLMILFTRFRNLPDEQMKNIADYVAAGKPVIALRTATHAFNYPEGKTYSKFSWMSKEPGWEGGFGRRILGETWVSHHGNHGHESTRGVITEAYAKDPLVRGCEDIWTKTDVYTVRLPLPGDCKPVILGQVLTGMNPTDKPVDGPKNNPMLPVAWTKTYKGDNGETGRVLTTTMGSGEDLLSEGLRRLLVQGAYWCVGMEDKLTAPANVDFVGEYKPQPFAFFGPANAGSRPCDFAMPK